MNEQDQEIKPHFQKGSAKFLRSFANAASLEAWLQENNECIGYAMVGRSNVGKSSLINSFLGKKTAKTSNTPGRTREINLFEFRLHKNETPFYLYDLPGYGHAKVSKEMTKNWQSLMHAFFQFAPHSTLLLNIQDARHPNQKSDQAFQDYIKPFERETFLIFNKMDKLKKQKERSALDKLKPVIFKEYKWVKQIFFVSAETKQGLEPLEDAIISFMLFKEDYLKSCANLIE